MRFMVHYFYKPFNLKINKFIHLNPYSISKATSDFFVNYFQFKIDCIITNVQIILEKDNIQNN